MKFTYRICNYVIIPSLHYLSFETGMAYDDPFYTVYEVYFLPMTITFTLKILRPGQVCCCSLCTGINYILLHDLPVGMASKRRIFA